MTPVTALNIGPGTAEAVLMRLLFVDAHGDTRLMLQSAFSSADCQVAVAGDPDEAMRLADAHPPDVVITDVRLPTVADGIRFVHDLHQRASTCRAPVVAVTSTVLSAEQSSLFAACFLKPVAPDVLRAELRQLAQKARASGSDSNPAPS